MRPALVGRLTPDLWGSRRSAGLYPTRTSLLAFTLSPAPEFVIAVRVVHGVPMIWSDRGNRQTNQKMVWSDNWISGVWLNPYPVVHCSAEPLFAAKIFLSSLHGHMPQ